VGPLSRKNHKHFFNQQIYEKKPGNCWAFCIDINGSASAHRRQTLPSCVRFTHLRSLATMPANAAIAFCIDESAAVCRESGGRLRGDVAAMGGAREIKGPSAASAGPFLNIRHIQTMKIRLCGAAGSKIPSRRFPPIRSSLVPARVSHPPTYHRLGSRPCTCHLEPLRSSQCPHR